MRRLVLCLCLLALGLVSACGGGQQEVDAYYSSDQNVLQTAFLSGEVDHVVRDYFGSYFCVLRRPDDLADLRAKYQNT